MLRIIRIRGIINLETNPPQFNKKQEVRSMLEVICHIILALLFIFFAGFCLLCLVAGRKNQKIVKETVTYYVVEETDYLQGNKFKSPVYISNKAG